LIFRWRSIDRWRCWMAPCSCWMVWRRNTRDFGGKHYGHEPLPALLYVNKMDRDGAEWRRSRGN
jgi:hypothetical protein